VKATGGYLGTSGSVSTTEKETLGYFLVYLIVLGVIVYAVYTLVKSIPSWLSGSLTPSGQGGVDVVVKAAGGTPSAIQTRNYWDAQSQYLGSGAIQKFAIDSGNALLTAPVVDKLGVPLLTQATVAGQEFRAELIKNDDLARLESDPLRGFIVAGEGISRTFTGFSPYEAGVATKNLLGGLRRW